MKRTLASAAIISATAGGALAGGLDRSGQPVGALFEEGGATGSYFELSFAHSAPDVGGTGVGRDFDVPLSGFGIGPGTSYSDVGKDFWSFGAAIKHRFSDRVSAALIFDQPFGTDVAYGGDPATTELGGTMAFAETSALTALLRYRFDERWSVHGGLRVQSAKGEIGLSGLSYGLTAGQLALLGPLPPGAVPTVNGYDVELDRDTAWGYVLGGAFEIPAIALRVALTYNSEVTHEMKTTEDGLGAFGLPDGLESETEVKTPQSVNLDLQTGIAEDTLLFGSVRWVDWSEFRIDPEYFVAITGEGLVDLDDTTTYQIGVARQLTDRWAGSVSVIYEPGTGELVSPLAPIDGFWALAVGAAYEVAGVTVSGGARYSWLGDALPETGTPDVARADFTDNTMLSLGLRIAYEF